MEDLRTKEQKKQDEKSWNSKNSKMYLGHIPSFRMSLWNIFKKMYKYIFFLIIIYLILSYPLEIGTFIGNWSYNFWSGLTNKL